MSPKETIFNVTVWFNNGESRTFGATQTKAVEGYLVIKSHNGNQLLFNLGIVAGFSEPFDKEVWE